MRNASVCRAAVAGRDRDLALDHVLVAGRPQVSKRRRFVVLAGNQQTTQYERRQARHGRGLSRKPRLSLYLLSLTAAIRERKGKGRGGGGNDVPQAGRVRVTHLMTWGADRKRVR